MEMAAKRHTGKVKWFDKLKGYGFIIPDDDTITGGREIYVHYSSIIMEGSKNLEKGEKVSFELVDEGKGPKAVLVAKLYD